VSDAGSHERLRALDEVALQEIVRRILSVTEPDRIIIFGSAARGKMTHDSDIDILVVARDPGDRRKKSEKRMIELKRECRTLERKLHRLHAKLRELALRPAALGSIVSLTADRLADLQDQIRSIEQRMASIRKGVLSLELETVDESDLVKALSIFDPVWESLNSRERHQVMYLLINRIAYDGRDGSVTVSFRSLGIKALCNEANMVYGGEHEA